MPQIWSNRSLQALIDIREQTNDVIFFYFIFNLNYLLLYYYKNKIKLNLLLAKT